MSLTLTPLQSDNFTRANVSPLTSPWALDEFGDPGLKIAGDVCECSSASAECVQFFTLADMPNDQYATVTFGASVPSGAGFQIYFRATDGGDTVGTVDWSEYLFRYLVGSWAVVLPGSNTILIGSGLTIAPGDTITVAAVGTTIYVYHNSTLLGSKVDTNYSSGSVALVAFDNSSTADVQFSNFVIGSAAVASTSRIFLGSVRQVRGIPSGQPDVFLGTVKVIGSAPAGAN